VYFAEKDPLRSPPIIDALASRIRRSGASFEEFSYPGSGHLFAEPGRSGYDAAATDLMLERVVEFLARRSVEIE
jgi:dienelactone hydrolase